MISALCAAQRGLSVEVLDQQPRWHARGFATLLHACSLNVLDELGLSGELVDAGKPLEHVAIYVGGERRKVLTLPSPALALSQSTLEESLHRAVSAARIPIRALHRASTLEQRDGKVQVRVVRGEQVTIGSPAHYSDWAPVDSSVVTSQAVVGADGYDSRIRATLGIDTISVGPTESFAMFEFSVAEDPGTEVRLCVTDDLCSVMIPLPNRRVRWGFQLASELSALADAARLRALLAERAPWYHDAPVAIEWSTVTHFERRLARRFGRGHVWLAGDAAHVTNPFGAQSMNVGMCEAADLSHRIADSIYRKTSSEGLKQYGHEREREWHKLMGVNVSFELLAHAPPWLAAHARRIVPALPASGTDLHELLSMLGLELS